MGDEWIFDSLFPSGSLCCPSEKIEAKHEGHVFTIDLAKMRAALPDVIRGYDQGATADIAVQLCAAERLPHIYIRDEAPHSRTLVGNIFGTSGSVGAQYTRRSDSFSGMIEIFAGTILRSEKRLRAGRARDKRFLGMDLRHFFACALAHEMRHWIQDVTAWTQRSQRSARAEYCWRRFFRIVPWLMPFGVSVVVALAVAVSARSFFSASLSPDFPALFFGPLIFFMVFLWSIMGCAMIRDGNRFKEGAGWIFAAYKSIDARYIRFVYRHYPLERDADEFSFAAMKDPRWLEVVSVEKMDVAGTA